MNKNHTAYKNLPPGHIPLNEWCLNNEISRSVAIHALNKGNLEYKRIGKRYLAVRHDAKIEEKAQ
jgi:hypothetical protein